MKFPAPTERFDPREPPIHTIPDYTVYACPKCPQQLQFRLHNFEDAARQPRSRLSADDDRKMSKAHGKLKTGEHFLDWYCPGCGQAVRVYYLWYVADRGIFFVELTRVLEPG